MSSTHLVAAGATTEAVFIWQHSQATIPAKDAPLETHGQLSQPLPCSLLVPQADMRCCCVLAIDQGTVVQVGMHANFSINQAYANQAASNICFVDQT